MVSGAPGTRGVSSCDRQMMGQPPCFLPPPPHTHTHPHTHTNHTTPPHTHQHTHTATHYTHTHNHTHTHTHTHIHTHTNRKTPFFTSVRHVASALSGRCIRRAVCWM